MTPFERLMSLYSTGWADRPAIGAFAMGLVPKLTPGLTIGECYENPLKFAKAYLRVQEMFGFDTGPLFGHACTGAAEWGGELSYPGPNSRAQSPIIRSHPIDTPEKVDKMDVPDPAKAGEIERMCAGARYVMANYPDGYKNPSLVAGTPFTWAGNAVGVETMLLWMIREPSLVHKVLKNVSAFLVDEARYISETVGPCMLFDGGPSDANDLISPVQFEQFALPSLKEVRLGALKNGIPGFLAHPCGNQIKNVEMWATVPGTFAINFDFRTPLPVILKNFGESTMILGNIEPAKFQYSNYDWLYDKTTEYLNLAATKVKHGYGCGPGCEIPTDTPPIHLSAMIQATRKYAQSKAWQDHKPK